MSSRICLSCPCGHLVGGSCGPSSACSSPSSWLLAFSHFGVLPLDPLGNFVVHVVTKPRADDSGALFDSQILVCNFARRFVTKQRAADSGALSDSKVTAEQNPCYLFFSHVSD